MIDLRLGELLVQIRKRQPQKLGFARLPDYTREEMGIPWRSALQLVSNWTALEKLPHLRAAHRDGRISKSKLRFLLRVATAENEAAWIEKASKVSVRALEEFVRAVDAGPRACISQTGPDGKCVPVAAGSGSGEVSEPDGKYAPVGPGSEPGEDSGTNRKCLSAAAGSGSRESSGTDGKCVPVAAGSGSGEGPGTDGKCVPAVGSSGSAAEADRAGYLMTLKTTSEKAAIWDFALEHFRGHEGVNFSTEVFIEALLAEFCSAIPLPVDGAISDAAGTVTGKPRNGIAVRHSNLSIPLDSTSVPIDEPLPKCRQWRRMTSDEDDEFLSGDGKEIDEEKERWQALRRDLEDVTQIWEFLSWTPVTVETPIEWDDAFEDIRAVANMIKKIVAMRQLVGFYMGRLLRTFENLHLYADMQFASFNHYVVERLGISMRTARNLIKLVRSFLSLPVLEKAFKDGVLTQQRALLLLKVAREKTEKEWLRYGTEVPVLDLEREMKRLSRLIEANPNLLDAYRVLPEFVPPENMKSDADSGKELLKAEGGSPDSLEKTSTTAVQMFASEAISDTVNPASEDPSVQMCAGQMLPDKTDPEIPDPSRKMCATEAELAGFTNELNDHPALSSTAGSATVSPGSPAGSPDRNTATIQFFIPDSLIPMWNYAFIRYLELAAGSETAQGRPSSQDSAQDIILSDHTGTEIHPAPSHHPAHSDDTSSLLEGFLFSLIYHYLENEHRSLKRMKRRLRHKVIERDGFRCIIPGCSSRAGLDDHHIRFRSQGGGNELPNNSSTCHLHHCQCIHDNRYITIKGQAPDNLTIAMGVEPGRSPFALFINGRRADSEQGNAVKAN